MPIGSVTSAPKTSMRPIVFPQKEEQICSSKNPIICELIKQKYKELHFGTWLFGPQKGAGKDKVEFRTYQSEDGKKTIIAALYGPTGNFSIFTCEETKEGKIFGSNGVIGNASWSDQQKIANWPFVKELDPDLAKYAAAKLWLEIKPGSDKEKKETEELAACLEKANKFNSKAETVRLPPPRIDYSVT
jgi:hypothetical protein